MNYFTMFLLFTLFFHSLFFCQMLLGDLLIYLHCPIKTLFCVSLDKDDLSHFQAHCHSLKLENWNFQKVFFFFYGFL